MSDDKIDERTGYRRSDKLSRRQAADVLGVSVPRLAQMRQRGLISHQKNTLTRKVHYVAGDVLDLRDRRESAVVRSDASGDVR